MPTGPGAHGDPDATAVRQPLTASRPRLSLTAAASLLGFEGDPVERVQFANKQVTAITQVDEAELARRAQVGLGPVLNYRLVEALASLPLGWPVSWEEIDPIVRAVLDCAPPGVLRATPAQVERLLRPAVRVTGREDGSCCWRPDTAGRPIWDPATGASSKPCTPPGIEPIRSQTHASAPTQPASPSR